MRVDQPIEWEIHHRKAKSTGGGEERRNKSLVMKHEHEAWHVLMYNVSVYNIARRLQFYENRWGKRTLTLEPVRVEGLIRGFNRQIEKKWAWKILFGGLTMEEILLKINKTWIDPDYQLVVSYDYYRLVALPTQEQYEEEAQVA